MSSQSKLSHVVIYGLHTAFVTFMLVDVNRTWIFGFSYILSLFFSIVWRKNKVWYLQASAFSCHLLSWSSWVYWVRCFYCHLRSDNLNTSVDESHHSPKKHREAIARSKALAQRSRSMEIQKAAGVKETGEEGEMLASQMKYIYWESKMSQMPRGQVDIYHEIWEGH